jgi:hypothetical protein
MGPQYSINYNRIFNIRSKIAYSYRLGFSIIPDGLSFPVGLNLINGFTSNLHAEFSFGLSPFIDRYKSFLGRTDNSDKYLYIFSVIGYRYQRPSEGLYFTAGFSPYIFLDPPSHNIFDVYPTYHLAGQLAGGFSF